jgi:hypothetical protein
MEERLIPPGRGSLRVSLKQKRWLPLLLRFQGQGLYVGPLRLRRRSVPRLLL